jgi:hypothetical protein
LGKSPEWKAVTNKEIESEELNWMNLGDDPEILMSPFKERMAVWKKLYKYNKDGPKEEL